VREEQFDGFGDYILDFAAVGIQTDDVDGSSVATVFFPS